MKRFRHDDLLTPCNTGEKMNTESPHDWMQKLSAALAGVFREAVKQAAVTLREFKAFLRVLANNLTRRKLRCARQRTTRGQNAQRRTNLKRLGVDHV